MKIGRPELVEIDDSVELRVPVETGDGARTLWYRLAREHADLVTEALDGPVIGLLIPAMRRGEELVVEGAVSEILWTNLMVPYQRLLQYMVPSLQRIRIQPEDTYGGFVRSPGVATGFSGGIDSFSVLADYHYREVPHGVRVTHLLFNNVGSHGPGGEELFRERHRRLLPFAERVGLPLIRVNTNLETFYEYDFAQTHTPRNASVAAILQAGVGRFLYASGYAFPQFFVRATTDTAPSDPFSLPLLSTETIQMASVGGEYTRVEKTLRVAEVEDSWTTLDVCTNAHYDGEFTNCGLCFKCLRTLFTLEVGGVLERYEPSFDLEAYRRHRREWMIEALASDNPLNREIIEFAESRGFPIPDRLRVHARARNARASVEGRLRSLFGRER